jgi:hypothetical protein
MQYNIALNVANSISNEGCSLDELVTKVIEVFDMEGLPGLLQLLLKLIDEHLYVDIIAKGSNAHLRPCCDQQRLESKGSVQRTIRSSLGPISFSFRCLRCTYCRKTQAPLKTFLKLDPYQRKTVELEQIVTEVITDQSYRRTKRHLQLVGGIDVPTSTLHRWVNQSPCDEVAEQHCEVAQIMPDGTGYKRRPNRATGQNNRGQLKVVIGFDDEGVAIPFGCWAGESWAEIGQAILGSEEAAERSRPLADDLVVDGEPGMIAGLRHLSESVQRCHWHLPRDLGYMMWQDGAPLEERKRESKKLGQLLAVEVPKESVQEIDETDLTDVLTRCGEAGDKLDDLIQGLRTKGYSAAANYVSNAKDHLFSYIATWVEYGICCPRTTSAIERLMREIGRRIKKIGFGWSEQGAAKMARIVIARILSPDKWKAHWHKRMNVVGNAMIVFLGAHVLP